MWILAAVITALHGVGLLFAVALVRNSRPRLEARGQRIYLSLLGVGCIGYGALLFLAVGFWSLVDTVFFDRFDADQAAAMFGYGVLAVLLVVSGFLLLWVNRALSRSLSIPEERTLHHNLIALKILGAFLPAASLLPLPLFVTLLGMVPLFLVTAGVVIAASNRRARQGNLLWLLAIAVEKRLPLPEELEAYSTTIWGSARIRVRELAQDLRDGIPLHEALFDFPGLVPQHAVLDARVGTETGTLGAALRGAAVRHSRKYEGTEGMRMPSWTFIYFWSVVLAMFNILVFLMYYIVPKMKKIFEDFGMEMPAVTETLIALSDGVILYGYFLSPLFFLPLIALIWSGLGYYVGWADIRTIPLIRWFPRFDTPAVLRSLACTIKAGHPLQMGLTLLAAFHHRMNIRQALAEVAHVDERGDDAWMALKAEGLINQHELGVLLAAERLGNLPWALESLADGIENRQRHRLTWWIDLVQPFVVFTTGLVVLFVMLAFFMPLVKLLNDLA